MKNTILKIAGVKNIKEFYDKFPTEEAFMKVHGEEFKMKCGGNVRKAEGGLTAISSIGSQGYSPQGLETDKLQAWGQGQVDKAGKMQGLQMPDFGMGVFTDLAEGISGLFQEKKKLQSAEQWKKVSDLSLEASRVKPEESARRYVRPEDVVNTGEEFFPIYGAGTNILGKDGIHIKSSKRGTFTAAATKHGKDVQEFASQVLANKDNYSPAMVKKANFAKNASKWNHEDGSKIKANFGAAMSTFDQAGGTDKLSGIITQLTGENAGGSIGGTVGGTVGSIFGPAGSVVGQIGGQLIGTVLDPMPRKIKKYTDQMNRNIDNMTLSNNISGVQQQYSSFMDDGGFIEPLMPNLNTHVNADVLKPIPSIFDKTRTYREKGPTYYDESVRIENELRNLQSKKKLNVSDQGRLRELIQEREDLLRHQIDTKMANGGEISSLNGDLKVNGGKAQPISYNPYLPDGGETVMFKGPSHEKGGIDILYGDSPVEVEGGEPAVKLKDGGGADNLVVFGNLTIKDEFAKMLGDEKAKGKKFKNYIADLSKEEDKYGKRLDESGKALNDFKVEKPIDKLTLNSYKLNFEGSDARLKEIAEKKQNAALLQDTINEIADENGLEAKALAKGKVKRAKMGTNVYKAEDGKRITPEERDYLISLYNAAIAEGGGDKVELFQKEFSRIAPDKAKEVLADFPVTNYGKAQGFTNEQLESNYDALFGPRTERYKVSLDDYVSPAPEFREMGYNAPPMEEEVVTPIEGIDNNYKLSWMDVVNSAIPYLRPSDAETLSPRQLAGEMYALSSNQLEPVKAQTFQPDLGTPYNVSFQDQLNEITARDKELTRLMGYNPAALSTMAGESYSAKSKVLADQFRTNQAMKDKVYSENRNLMNQSKLQNLGILDTQYVRQQEAKSATKNINQAAINSISSKYLQNQLENKTLQTYENMYNYRFGNDMRAQNWNPLAQFNIPTVGSSSAGGHQEQPPQGYEYIYNKDGEPIDIKKSKTVSGNGSIVKMSRNI